ncbi:MAG TPA: hypothetical protein VH120_15305 [Gemmataceae bacterium]|nr:hypothetical protein [Gemmataceae bacterium]
MARPTNTELILSVRDSLTTLAAQETQLRAELERVESAVERLTDQMVSLRDRSAEITIGIDRRTVVLETQVTDLRKAQEERDRQRWAITLAVIGSVLALVINIAVSFFRK